MLHFCYKKYTLILQLWNVLIGNFDILEDQNTVNEIKNKYPWVPEESVKKLAQLKVIVIFYINVKSNFDYFNDVSFKFCR